MKAKALFGLAFSIIILMMSMTVVSAADLKNTAIDYIPYREVVPSEAGVIYKIKITNTGNTAKTYEIVPNVDAVKSVGTYRIDPSERITLLPDQDETIYFYLALEKAMPSRLEVPISIYSGSERTDLVLSARTVGPIDYSQQNTGFAGVLINILMSILIVIILIALLVAIFRRTRKDNGKGKNKDDDSEVETYY